MAPIDARVALVARVVLAALVRVRVRCAVESSVEGRAVTPIDARVVLAARAARVAIAAVVPVGCHTRFLLRVFGWTKP